MGVCVTVPTTTDGASITTHPAVIFAVKDQGGCEDDFNGWKCNGPFENSCSCSGTQAACVYEPITTCAPRCGDGVVDRPQEECDDGNNINNDSCSNTCLRNTGPGCDDPTGGGCNGDPHFKTWRGHHFDFHGECDLVLLHSSTFGAGLGLDVHIRTKMRRDMSYISAAVLRMGMDTLEVESQGVYYLNGVAGAELPAEFSGFAFSHTQPTGKQHVFEVDLGGRERVKLKTYKDFVSVLIEQGQSKNFGDSVGLMGDFGQGRMLARDGKTILNDPNAFGQEWQVLHTEPSLFQTLRLPQHPMECTLPPRMEASQLRRRLLESSSVDELAAEKACAEWGEGKDDCVFDVLTTGDLDMAMAGSY
jgi:cysteine-rich repeat protein